MECSSPHLVLSLAAFWYLGVHLYGMLITTHLYVVHILKNAVLLMMKIIGTTL